MNAFSRLDRRALLRGLAGAAVAPFVVRGAAATGAAPEETALRRPIGSAPVATAASADEPALFGLDERLGAAIPWAPLIVRPTPCHPLLHLSREIGGEIWIKRDDLTSPLYGGNKARKNEFLFADLQREGCNAVLTMGGIGSHHCCSVAATARTLGWPTTLVQFPQPVTDHVRLMLRWQQLWKPQRVLARAQWTLPFAVLRGWNRLDRRPGLRPGLIWMGGSSPVGTLGYVDAALEFSQQVRCGHAPMPERIYVAAGSGGTLAGLIAGFRLAQLPVKVVGVQIVPTPAITRLSVAWLANAALDLIREAAPGLALPEVSRDEILLDDRFLGAGYGVPTSEGRAARRLVAELEGLPLEDTYTAKTMAALLAAARSRRVSDGPLLFWNTYNSIPPPPLPDWRDLPEPYHRFFVG